MKKHFKLVNAIVKTSVFLFLVLCVRKIKKLCFRMGYVKYEMYLCKSAIVLLVIFAGISSVQSASQYTVVPLVIDVTAESRDIITKEITITNNSGSQVTVYPTVNNVSVGESGTIETFVPPVESDRTRSLASWIEISRLGIDIKSGESRKIPVTLRINFQTLPGTYHAFVGFGTGRNRDEAEIQVKNGQAPGTVITVTIAEKRNVILKLSKFIVDRFVTKSNNQAAVLSFKNPGDETLVPTGEIILYNSKGNEVGALVVNEEKIQIPPGGEHVFTAPIPVDGKFGKYKAFLSVEYGDTQKGSVQDTSFFYIFPLKKILIILGLVLLVAVLFAWFYHKKYFKDDGIDGDSDTLTFHIRDTVSEPKDHDVVLKSP